MQINQHGGGVATHERPKRSVMPVSRSLTCLFTVLASLTVAAHAQTRTLQCELEFGVGGPNNTLTWVFIIDEGAATVQYYGAAGSQRYSAHAVITSQAVMIPIQGITGGLIIDRATGFAHSPGGQLRGPCRRANDILR